MCTVGHEFTHGVVDKETSLIYAGTGGAINEGYADIFGNYIDAINYNNIPDWSHGNHHMLSGVGYRDLAHPNNSGNPEKVGDSFFHDYKGVKDDHYGVHTNGSLFTRAAYLMENGDTSIGIYPISNPSLVQDIWYRSLCNGYTAKTDFYDVRLNVVGAANQLGLSSSDITKINDIFDEVGITKSNCDEGNDYFKNNWKYWLKSIFGEITDFSNTLSGKAFIADTDGIVSNNSVLSNVDISVEDFIDSKSILKTTTNSFGNYSVNNFFLDNLVIQYSKIGYLPETQYIVDNPNTTMFYCNDVELIPQTYSGIGTAKGSIKDAVRAKGVSGLRLNFRKGLNNKSYTTIVGTTTTDENGNYSISLNAGNYCVEVVDDRQLTGSSENYATTYFNIKVLGNITINNQDGVVSNNLNKEQVRIVLTWGESPRDLDSHLYGPTFNGIGEFHVYYGSKSYSYNGNTVALLDVDDTSSYGPETTTIYNPINGTYKFSVYNYSGSPSILSSNARVQVYIGNSNIASYTFNVPSSGNGRTWNVFKYQSATKTIIPVNTMS